MRSDPPLFTISRGLEEISQTICKRLHSLIPYVTTWVRAAAAKETHGSQNKPCLYMYIHFERKRNTTSGNPASILVPDLVAEPHRAIGNKSQRRNDNKQCIAAESAPSQTPAVAVESIYIYDDDDDDDVYISRDGEHINNIRSIGR